jgi:hypothetical protein
MKLIATDLCREEHYVDDDPVRNRGRQNSHGGSQYTNAGILVSKSES